MNIITPTILPSGVAQVTRLAEIAPLIPTVVTPPVAVSAAGSAIVEVSRLGQFLSSVSEFQRVLARLQSSSTTGTQDPNADFDKLSTATQRLVEAFNSLRSSSIADLRLPIDTLTGESLSDQFAQVLNQHVDAVYDNGTSEFTRLSQIGIHFEGSSVAGNATGLSIDLPTLQSAFNSDRAGTISLLSQAAGGFGTLAGTFAQLLGTLSSGEGLGTLLGGNLPQGLDFTELFGADTSLISAGFSVDAAALQNLLASEALDTTLLENPAPVASQGASNEPTVAPIATRIATVNEPLELAEGYASEAPAEETSVVQGFVDNQARAGRTRIPTAIEPLEVAEGYASAAPAGETSVVQGFVDNQARAGQIGVADIALADISPTVAADILQTSSTGPAARAQEQLQSTNDASVATNLPVSSTPQDSAREAATNSVVTARSPAPIREAVPTATDAATDAIPAPRVALPGATSLIADTADTEIRNLPQVAAEPLASRLSASAPRLGVPPAQTSTTAPVSRDTPARATNEPIENALLPADATTAAENEGPRVATIASANRPRDFTQDPSVVAAIAAYHLNEGLFGPLTSAVHERASIRKETIPQVEPVIRVAPVEKLRS